METRYPDAPDSEKGSTIKTGDWFQDYGAEQLDLHWGISPRSYHPEEYQLTKGEGRFAEFKHDPHTKYNRLSIEVGERAQASGPWVVSGIFRTSTPFYIQGDKHSIWVMPTHSLRAFADGRGIWYDWEDKKFSPHTSQLIDERKITSSFNGTLRRFYLYYDEAKALGGIELEHR